MVLEITSAWFFSSFPLQRFPHLDFTSFCCCPFVHRKITLADSLTKIYLEACLLNVNLSMPVGINSLLPSVFYLQISNTEGELYSLSVRSPRFKWVQDLSLFDKSFTITPGNNGRLYVTVAVKAILLALDVNTGTVLWQRNFGPLSTADCAPVIDSNGK